MWLEKITIKSLLLLAFALVLTALSVETTCAIEEVKFIGELNEGLQEPVDTAVAENGDIYVLDQKLCQVFVFSSDGTLIRSIGEKGDQFGQLKSPQSITIAKNGNVVVADTGNGRVQVFSAEGIALYQLGRYGKRAGEFREPNSLAVDRSGNIFIGDSTNKTITQFSSQGTYLKHKKQGQDQ